MLPARIALNASLSTALLLAMSAPADAIGPVMIGGRRGGVVMTGAPVVAVKGGGGSMRAGFGAGPVVMAGPQPAAPVRVHPQHALAPTFAVPHAAAPAAYRPVPIPSYPQPVVPNRPYAPAARVGIPVAASHAPYYAPQAAPVGGAVGMLAQAGAARIVNKIAGKIGIAAPQPVPAWPGAAAQYPGQVPTGYGVPGYGPPGYPQVAGYAGRHPAQAVPLPQPVVVNRPVFQRPPINVFNNVTNVTTINNVTNIGWQNVNVAAGGSAYRPWTGHFDHLHSHWCSGHWKQRILPAIWVAARNAGWSSLGTTGWTYANPYYVRPAVVDPAFDYARPIVTVSAGVSQYDQPRITEEVVRVMAAAREAFRRGEYNDARQLAERAIALLPADRTLHEFRALTLFAQADYRAASATIYAVLASGPGWDADTLGSLYPDGETYTTHVKSLGNFVRNNPDRADARFLMAYHLLTLGYGDAALEQLEIVLRLQPNDRVARELAQAISQPVGR